MGWFMARIAPQPATSSTARRSTANWFKIDQIGKRSDEKLRILGTSRMSVRVVLLFPSISLIALFSGLHDTSKLDTQWLPLLRHLS